MADHAHVCSASGLTIDRGPVRVILLSKAEFASDSGLEGHWYARGPALRAKWDRGDNAPAGWTEDAGYRLAYDQFKVDVVGVKRRSMADLLGCLPCGLETRTVRPLRDHPDTYKTKLGKPRPAPWVPTPSRARRVLKAAGLVGYAAAVSYGQVKAYPPHPGDGSRPSEGWFDDARAAFTAAGYALGYDKDPNRGDSLVVRCGTAPLTLNDVRAALRSGGWPESSGERVEEPAFIDHTTTLRGCKPITSTASQQRESWAMFDVEHGFLVCSTDAGFWVSHGANGTPDPQAESLDAYRQRLRACGIRAEIENGSVRVPSQERSFESFALQRRMRYLDAPPNRYQRETFRRRRSLVSWAVVREDVWQSLLATDAAPDLYGQGVTFAARKATCVRVFAKFVADAVRALGKPENRAFYGDVERELVAGDHSDAIQAAVGSDPPYRLGPKWSMCRLAVLKARGEVTDAECAEAVTAFAELAHVRAVQ